MKRIEKLTPVVVLSGLLLGCSLWYTKIAFKTEEGGPYLGYVQEIQRDAQGNELVFGYHQNFEANPRTGFGHFVAKFSSTGSLMWKVTPQDSGNTSFPAPSANQYVAIDSSNNTLYAYSTGDDSYAELVDDSGNLLWSQHIPSYWAHHRSVAITEGGTYLLKSAFIDYYEVYAFSVDGEPLWQVREDYFEPAHGDSGTAELTTLGEYILVKDKFKITVYDEDGLTVQTLLSEDLGGESIADISSNTRRLVVLVKTGRHNPVFKMAVFDDNLNLLQIREAHYEPGDVASLAGRVSISELGTVCYAAHTFDHVQAIGSLSPDFVQWHHTPAASLSDKEFVAIKASDQNNGQCALFLNEYENSSGVYAVDKKPTSWTHLFGDSGDIVKTFSIKDVETNGANVIQGRIYIGGGELLDPRYQAYFPAVSYFRERL